MKYLLTIIMLLACQIGKADNITDLRDWQRDGLIVVSNWNVDGYKPDDHARITRAGNRFVPTYKLIPLNSGSSWYIGWMASAENDSFIRDNKLPVSIRTENIPTVFIKQPRLPLVPESIPISPLVWSFRNGTLNDEGRIDVFGPPEVWRKAGEEWGRSAMVAELQRRFPDAPFVLFAENNETGRDLPGIYVDSSTPSPDYYPDRIPKWLPLDTLKTLSLRVYDYAASGKTVNEFQREFNVRQDGLYNALYAGFNDSLTAWKGRLLTESYKIPVYQNDWDVTTSSQYSPQFGHCDAGGGGLYVASSNLWDFTGTDWFRVYLGNPVHAKAETLNPKHVREVFLNLTPGGTFTGFQKGRHEVVNQERYAAHIQWLLWSMKGDRKPVHLRYWLDSKDKPSTPFCDTDAARKIVTDAGYPELATATEEMPIAAVNQAVNTILDHPVLRKFWIEGKPVQTGTHPANELRFKQFHKARVYPQPGDKDDGFRLLEILGDDVDGKPFNTSRDQWLIPPSSQNNGRWNENARISIWGTATELNGEYLVHLESQRKLSGTCKVRIPGVDEPLEMPVPQPNLYRVVRRSGWTVNEIE